MAMLCYVLSRYILITYDLPNGPGTRFHLLSVLVSMLLGGIITSKVAYPNESIWKQIAASSRTLVPIKVLFFKFSEFFKQPARRASI